MDKLTVGAGINVYDVADYNVAHFGDGMMYDYWILADDDIRGADAGMALEIAPSISYQLSDSMTAGLGIDWIMGLSSKHNKDALHSLSFSPFFDWSVYPNAHIIFKYNIGIDLSKQGKDIKDLLDISTTFKNNVQIGFTWRF
jgi:hypothetical protein